jgi:hypothetical protein
MNKKIGLSVIYNSHNLYQFIWYYYTYGRDLEWYALCLPGMDINYLKKLCEKCGIFEKIYFQPILFDSLSLKKKIFLFLKMFLYFVIGKRKSFCKKFISNYICGLNFNTAVVLTDYGFVAGLFLSLGDEKEIIILEDGMGDYIDRKYSNIFRMANNFFVFQGFFLSLMGYANTGYYFPLGATSKCIKFCSWPEKMIYRKYKKILQLFDFTLTDKERFKDTLHCLFPDLRDCFQGNYDAIIFSSPLHSYVSDATKYKSLIEKFIGANYKSILIKKHPRDTIDYNFDNSVKVREIDRRIPAEILLPFLHGIEIIFCDFSSTVLSLKAYNYNPKFIYFSTLKRDNSLETNVPCHYKSRENFEQDLFSWGFSKSIIEL